MTYIAQNNGQMVKYDLEDHDEIRATDGARLIQSAGKSDRKKFVSKVFTLVGVQFFTLLAGVTVSQWVANSSQNYWLDQCRGVTGDGAAELQKVPDSETDPELKDKTFHDVYLKDFFSEATSLGDASAGKFKYDEVSKDFADNAQKSKGFFDSFDFDLTTGEEDSTIVWKHKNRGNHNLSDKKAIFSWDAPADAKWIKDVKEGGKVTKVKDYVDLTESEKNQINGTGKGKNQNTLDSLAAAYKYRVRHCWTKNWVGSRSELLWILCIAAGVYLITSIMFCCPCLCGDIGRRFPGNYIALTLFTLSLSTIASVVTLWYTSASVFICLGITVLIVFALAAFAVWTDIDFTGCGIYLLIIGLLLVCTSMLAGTFYATGLMSFKSAYILRYAVNIGVALLCAIWIVWDVQMIVGGKSKHQFALDEHCVAAAFLFSDIVEMFLRVLLIGGEKK